MKYVHLTSDKPPKEEDDEYTPPTGWTPNIHTPGLDLFTKNSLKQLPNIPKIKIRHNFSKEETDALINLSKNEQIVIKPADKGGAVVIMNKQDYIDKCEQLLRDQKHYRRTGQNLTESVSEKLANYLRHCKKQKLLKDRIVDHLIPKSPRTAIFYILPKVHKEGVPGRPIISANECPTEKISEYIDFYIRPLAKKVASYIKDSGDFLEKIRKIEKLDEDTWLVTIDVSALYTNIPHEEGLRALREALSKRPSDYPPQSVILSLARFILTNNVFEFNKNYYIQTSGTAMGTRMAPSYAILFMDAFEQQIRTMNPNITNYYRFLDDIFITIKGTENELNNFLTSLNTLHDSIKFTWEYSKKSINFLDIQVTKQPDGTLRTGLYTKPTDAHTYLDYRSCHPPHIKKSIPYSQALRLCRICSDEQDRMWELNKMKHYFTDRNFPAKHVQQCIDLAISHFKHPQIRTRKEPIPLVLNYDPRMPQTSKKLLELTEI